jgi:hypothetical protein
MPFNYISKQDESLPYCIEVYIPLQGRTYINTSNKSTCKFLKYLANVTRKLSDTRAVWYEEAYLYQLQDIPIDCNTVFI